MWEKKYKDYPEDTPLKKERVPTGKGISGFEMSERNGWGLTDHKYRRKKGIIAQLILLFGGKR